MRLDALKGESGYNQRVGECMFVGDMGVANGVLTDGCMYTIASLVAGEGAAAAGSGEAPGSVGAGVVRGTQAVCLAREKQYHEARLIAHSMVGRGVLVASDEEERVLKAVADGLEKHVNNFVFRRHEAERVYTLSDDALAKVIDVIDTERGVTMSRRLGVLAVLNADVDLGDDPAGAILERVGDRGQALAHAALRQLIAYGQEGISELDENLWRTMLAEVSHYPRFVGKMEDLADIVFNGQRGGDDALRAVRRGLLSFVAWRP